MANVSEMSPSSSEVSSEDTKQSKVSPALAEVAVWLLESPNNPDYPNSPAYARFKKWLDENQATKSSYYRSAIS